MAKIDVQGTEITVLSAPRQEEFLCLTDIARRKDTSRTDYCAVILQN